MTTTTVQDQGNDDALRLAAAERGLAEAGDLLTLLELALDSPLAAAIARECLDDIGQGAGRAPIRERVRQWRETNRRYLETCSAPADARHEATKEST